MEDIELQEVKTNGDHGATHDGITAGNGAGAACGISDVDECEGLLSPQTADHNGQMVSCSNAAENGRNLGNAKRSSVYRVKEELNDVVFWKIRLWMVIVFMFLLIAAVILISLLLCSMIYDDPDEKFDPSLFKVPLHFNGSFQLPNLAFTEELITRNSSESQALAADIQNKLADLYRSSPALGRYFNSTEIHGFRNGSVIVDYQLTFLMPEENQDQLRNFTLSREMVFNVFRQFLYDQETDESAQAYIDPLSLIMFLGH